MTRKDIDSKKEEKEKEDERRKRRKNDIIIIIGWTIAYLLAWGWFAIFVIKDMVDSYLMTT